MSAAAVSIIRIDGLRVRARVGVPPEEREVAQELLVDIEIETTADFSSMEDDLSRTVDYHAIALRIEDLAAERPRRLIETLAADCADAVLAFAGGGRVRVTVRKFILPQTNHVAVIFEKSRPAGDAGDDQ